MTGIANKFSAVTGAAQDRRFGARVNPSVLPRPGSELCCRDARAKSGVAAKTYGL